MRGFLRASSSRLRTRMGESDDFPTLFIAWRDPVAELSEADLERLARAAARLRGLAGGLAFTPISVEGDHPFARDGRGPPLVLQLDFERGGRFGRGALGRGTVGRNRASRRLAEPG